LLASNLPDHLIEDDPSVAVFDGWEPRTWISPRYPCNACHSDPRAKARGGGTCFFSLLGTRYSGTTASAPP